MIFDVVLLKCRSRKILFKDYMRWNHIIINNDGNYKLENEPQETISDIYNLCHIRQIYVYNY